MDTDRRFATFACNMTCRICTLPVTNQKFIGLVFASGSAGAALLLGLVHISRCIWMTVLYMLQRVNSSVRDWNKYLSGFRIHIFF